MGARPSQKMNKKKQYKKGKKRKLKNEGENKEVKWAFWGTKARAESALP